MPLDPTSFTALRPYLYHLAAAANLPLIRQTRRLEPASVLLDRAGRPEIGRERRAGDVPVTMPDGRTVVIRNQTPFSAGSVHLEGGWTVERLLAEINRRVFFWPGDGAGPISYGRNHFAAYAGEAVVILVVPTATLDLSAAEFTDCNSGSPRCNSQSPHPGRKALRGPRTFLPADAFEGTPGDVVEVVFPGGVDLPWEAVRVMEPTAFPARGSAASGSGLPG